MYNMFFQLLKRAENAEKERDAAVIRYATREADVLRLNGETEKLESEVFYPSSLLVYQATLIMSSKSRLASKKCYLSSFGIFS